MEKSKTKLVQTCTECSAPWITFADSCYLIDGTAETNTAASDECDSFGAQLVSINSQAEQTFIEGEITG